jgi:hypothetical protein
VKYRDNVGNSANSSFDVENDEQLTDKLLALQNNTSVMRIDVFKMAHGVERADFWTTVLPAPAIQEA